MKCPKCSSEMKFLWDGNPDGNIAHECLECGCYQLKQDPSHSSYHEAVITYEIIDEATKLLAE